MLKTFFNLFRGSNLQPDPQRQPPSDVEPAPPAPPLPLSRLELFFLSKFEKPTNPEDASEYLKAILQCNAVETTKKFFDAGLIVGAAEIESLLASTKQADLKQALRDAGLKVSGKKEDLAQRLFESKPEIARQLVRGPFFVLSAEGREQVLTFQNAEDLADGQYTAEWLHCFDQGDVGGVLRAHRAYWQWMIKPPESPNSFGMSLPDDRALEMYRAIMDAKPAILGDIDSSDLLYLRRCVAWDFASGGRGGSSRFPVPPNFRCVLEPGAAARMVLSSATYTVQMRTARRTGIGNFELLISGDGCSHCRTFSGKTFTASKVPELPHAKCTHPMGCRCIAILKSF
jgi:hypothetical protein